MFINLLQPRKSLTACFALWLMLTLVVPALAQQSTAGGGIKTTCPNPGQCFITKEAKDKWAQDNKCQFLEDVCEKTPASQDNKGAKPEDAGFWSKLWNNVSGALQYGYEFSKGLFTGLISQVTDIIDLISDPVAIAQGLITLGKAFYDDPKGTLAALAELLGQEAVDTITKATQCGAYDLGKVIGSYVSPAVALKLAAKLGKFSGKIADAVKATKLDLGCASFTAGTSIHTPQGMSAIERITTGGLVESRNETQWHDKAQQVSNTFGRMAPSYRQLQTEFEVLSLTDEHPLWVQGKGWTHAKDVVQDDILAALKGDVLVRANTVVAKPVQVYNFSVSNTPNYFVGEAGVWAHNAKCTLTRPNDIKNEKYGLLDSATKGFKGELMTREAMEKAGYTLVKGVDNKADDALAKWKGQNGIDGIYQKDGKWVIVESKATGGVNPSDPSGCVAGLCNTQGSGRQMSNEWIEKRISDKNSGLTEDQVKSIRAGLKDGTTQRVYAQSDDASGTKFFTIVDKSVDGVRVPNEAVLGVPWNK